MLRKTLAVRFLIFKLQNLSPVKYSKKNMNLSNKFSNSEFEEKMKKEFEEKKREIEEKMKKEFEEKKKEFEEKKKEFEEKMKQEFEEKKREIEEKKKEFEEKKREIEEKMKENVNETENLKRKLVISEFFESIPKFELEPVFVDKHEQKTLLGILNDDKVDVPLLKVFETVRIDTSRLVFLTKDDQYVLLDKYEPNKEKKVKIFLGPTGSGKTHR
jgi:flagellar biosynthesis GTPase FlhF